MALKYDFKEKPNPTKEEGEQPLFPRVVVKGKITSEKLIKSMASRTTFSEAEMEAMMGLLSEEMAYYISEGYSVQLADIGYFTASLTARPVMSKEEIRSPSISIKGINFRPSKVFKMKLQPVTMVRAEIGFCKSDQLPLEKRKELLDRYLQKNGFIQRKAYSRITGLLKDKALKDLNKWVEEGYLRSQGRTASKIYLPGKKEKE